MCLFTKKKIVKNFSSFRYQQWQIRREILHIICEQNDLNSTRMEFIADNLKVAHSAIQIVDDCLILWEILFGRYLVLW